MAKRETSNLESGVQFPSPLHHKQKPMLKTIISKKKKKYIRKDLTNIYSINSTVQTGSGLQLVQKQGMPVIAFTTKTLIEFFQLWPLEQWVYSLIGLVLLYWATTKIYNKRLKRKYNTELTVYFRVYMIVSDLLINLALGLYYLSYRETTLGQLMVSCPIAVSPLIFIVELILVIFWYEIYKKNK